jgi:hypothetical protein
MVNHIIKCFYDLSREHILIRSFKYDRVSKGAGTSNDLYPQCFLEDPILLGDTGIQDGKVKITVNFNILLTARQMENYEIKQPDAGDCQSLAHRIALQYISKMRRDYAFWVEGKRKAWQTGIEVLSYSFITLRRWYDDAASGIRCTAYISIDNPINFCDFDEFDPKKQFPREALLPCIDTADASGCVDFSYKLPKIKF